MRKESIIMLGRFFSALLLVILANTVSAGALVMDAAELDVHGQPLANPWVFAAFDNRLGATDVHNVSFTMLSLTGQSAGCNTYFDPMGTPWEGATGFATDWQIVNGKGYLCGLSQSGNGTAMPMFRVDLTPYDHTDDGESTYDIDGTVPAGVIWCWASEYLGTDVHLFHSPAQGEFVADGVVTSLSDSDRTPDLSIPEPCTLSLLVVGGLAILRRRARA